jgi:hypothetical protein
MSESAVSDRLAVVQRGRRLEYFTVGWNAIEGMVAALRIVGVCFLLLAAYVAYESVSDL